MTIFKVQSNLNHNGESYKAGSYLEGEAPLFESLVADNVLKPVEGATSFAEAAEIEAEEAAFKAAQEEEEKGVAPENTWGPKTEEEKAPEEAKEPVVDAPAPETTEGQVSAPTGDTTPVVDAPAPAQDVDLGNNL